jgi:hypothetical protein
MTVLKKIVLLAFLGAFPAMPVVAKPYVFFKDSFKSLICNNTAAKLAALGGLLFYLHQVSSEPKEVLNGGAQNFEKKDGELNIVTANINLMPKGLNLATSGDADKRALQICDALLKQHPNTDVYFLQEMYDDQASSKIIERMKAAGFDYYAGPTKEQLKKHWDAKKYSFSADAAKNSGEAFFVRKDNGLRIESYDVLAFCEHGVEGIGVLETYVPKGVIHVKLSSNTGNKSISIFGYHLQAEIGLFGLSYFAQGEWSKLSKTVLSDLVHLQPFQILREKYPNYLEEIRKRQIQATKKWIDDLQAQGKVAECRVHLGDFNLIAGTQEYKKLLKELQVVPATDSSDLVTIGNQANTTWSRFTRPLYRFACKYVNNYGWMDLVLVNAALKNKIKSVAVIGLKNNLGQSVTDHESVSVVLNNVF